MINGKGVKELAYKIKDNMVIGGDKDVTPFGNLIFERIHITNDSRIADYFRNKTGYTVTEIAEDSEESD